MGTAVFKKQTSSKHIKSVGTPRHPSWQLWGAVKVRGPRVLLGTVSCPCNVGIQRMSEEEALRTIVGQVAAISIPNQWMDIFVKARISGRKDFREANWNAKVGIATVKMLKCWEKKCQMHADQAASTLEDLVLDAQKNRYVDLDLSDKFGGGTEC